MFEKFLRANSQDFRQRYENTFGYFRDEKGHRTLTQLMAVGEDVCIFTDVRGMEYRLNADSERDIGFEFIPPKSGYFNIEGGAILVQRVAAHQFQRGVSSRNMAFNRLFGGLRACKLTFPLMEQIYEKAVPPEKLVPIPDGLTSLAISPQFAFDFALNRVFVLASPIGVVNRDPASGKFLVTLEAPRLWRTEILDAARAIKLPVEVR
jgi:hypothetical protein